MIFGASGDPHVPGNLQVSACSVAWDCLRYFASILLMNQSAMDQKMLTSLFN
jgi:hypothetical protein